MPMIAISGESYHVREVGSGPAVILLHGFSGSMESWAELAPTLGETHRTLTIDLLGHGASTSPQSAERYAFRQMLADLVALADSLQIRNAAWLGYSMGGRLALGMAIEFPEYVNALILESASPGIADHEERQQRSIADNALADQIEQGGVPAFVDRWERLPLWKSEANLAPGIRERLRAQRLRNNATGLAGSLRGTGTGAQPSYWDRLPALHCPTLVITGELDEKFSTIGSAMADRMPNAALAIVPGAGHAVHREAPGAMRDQVCRFLSTQDPENQTAIRTGGLA